MNELLIKPDLSDLTEEKEEDDVVEESVEEENGSRGDCVSTATSLETALNLVITPLKSLEISIIAFYYMLEARLLMLLLFSKCLTPVFAVSSATDK